MRPSAIHDRVSSLLSQAKNPDTPLDITDWPVKEHLTGDWQARVHDRIRPAALSSSSLLRAMNGSPTFCRNVGTPCRRSRGSPRGYVGYGVGGVVTETVRRRPYSVVLLDTA